MSFTTGCRNADEAMAYVDKAIDNIADLAPDLPWENVEVVAMLEDIRSLLLTGAVVPGTFIAEANVEIRCDYCGDALPSVEHRSHVPTTPDLQRLGFSADKLVCPECAKRAANVEIRRQP